MNWFVFVVGTVLGLITAAYPAFSTALRGVHWIIAAAKAAGAPPVQPPSFLHWSREHLRWPGLALILPWQGLASLIAVMTEKPAWGWDAWLSLALQLACWWGVDRWHDNRDCNCDDDRHRRKSEAKSKVEARAGRLVVVPA